MTKKDNIIRNKSYQFALKTIELYKKLCKQPEFVISKQLLKSGTSIGANVEEATAAQSKKDFIAKMSIASKEARENNYWLRLLKDSGICNGISFDTYLKDSDEIIKIITAIVKTSQTNS